MTPQDCPQEVVVPRRLVPELGLREVGDIDGYLERSFKFAERQREVCHADAADQENVHIAVRRPLPPCDRAVDKGQVYAFPERLQHLLHFVG